MFLYSLSSCVWISFAHLPNCGLIVHIFAPFRRSCSLCSPSLCSYNSFTFLLLFQARVLELSNLVFSLFFLVMFLLLFQVAFLTILLDHVLVAPSSHSYCSKLATKVIATPSSHSCCSYRSCSCCFKLVARILVASSSHSCCFSWSCSYCSKVAFLLFLSVMFLLLQAHFQMLLFPIVFLLLQTCIWMLFFSVAFLYLSLLSYYLKFKILLEYFHVAFGFLIFCFMFWSSCSSLLAAGFSKWLFLSWLYDVVVL